MSQRKPSGKTRRPATPAVKESPDTAAGDSPLVDPADVPRPVRYVYRFRFEDGTTHEVDRDEYNRLVIEQKRELQKSKEIAQMMRAVVRQEFVDLGGTGGRPKIVRRPSDDALLQAYEVEQACGSDSRARAELADVLVTAYPISIGTARSWLTGAGIKARKKQ